MIDSVIDYFSSPGKAGESRKMVETIPVEQPSSCRVSSSSSSFRTSSLRDLELQHPGPGDWSRPQLAPSSLPSSSTQLVWDITANCYQELPVYLQSPPPYPPSLPPYPTCPPGPLAPPDLPLGDLFGGVIMDMMDSLYTSGLVHYVCQRTKPSPNRLAAETLARSNLNPNAKEFMPEVKHKSGEDAQETQEAAAGDDSIEEAEDDVGEESADSEDWWDSDEDEPGNNGHQIDPAEFEDLFPCGLSLTSLQCQTALASSLAPTPAASPPKCVVSTFTITLSCAPVKVNKTLVAANRRFQQAYSEAPLERCAARVTFSEEISVVEEDEEEAEALAEARPGDFKQRQADRERMERCIGPVLTRVHREKVWEKLQVLAQAVSCQSDSLTGGQQDSQTGGQSDSLTGGQPDSQTGCQSDSLTGGQSDSQTVYQSDSLTGKQLDSQTVGQLDSLTGGQLDSQTVGQS